MDMIASCDENDVEIFDSHDVAVPKESKIANRDVRLSQRWCYRVRSEQKKFRKINGAE
jgi:hypothetical protein